MKPSRVAQNCDAICRVEKARKQTALLLQNRLDTHKWLQLRLHPQPQDCSASYITTVPQREKEGKDKLLQQSNLKVDLAAAKQPKG